MHGIIRSKKRIAQVHKIIDVRLSHSENESVGGAVILVVDSSFAEASIVSAILGLQSVSPD